MSYRTEVRCDAVKCQSTASLGAADDTLPSGWLGVRTTNNRNFGPQEVTGHARHLCPSHTKQLFGYDDAPRREVNPKPTPEFWTNKDATAQ